LMIHGGVFQDVRMRRSHVWDSISKAFA